MTKTTIRLVNDTNMRHIAEGAVGHQRLSHKLLKEVEQLLAVLEVPDEW